MDDELPEDPRCRTCGATEQDGNGRVRVYKGVMQCARCKQGAIDLIKEQPENYGWDPVRGGLYRKTRDPWVETVEAEVRALYSTLTSVIAELGVGATVELTHPRSFASVIMANGYRWHVYIAHQDPTGSGLHTTQLFTPGREWVYGVLVPLDKDVDESARLVGTLTQAASGDTNLRHLIEDDAFRRVEVNSVDVDALVRQLLGD